jgi:multidrug transporter EmrE-like cation transporter
MRSERICDGKRDVIFLFLRIFCNTAFAQLLKWVQVRDGQMLPAALVNYLVAALLSGFGLLLSRSPTPHAASLWYGVATGLLYALSMLCIEVAMHTDGVGITVAVLHLSAVVVPTLFAMAFLHERPDSWQSVGIVAAIVALPLLSGPRAIADSAGLRGRKAAPAMLLLFLSNGCSSILMKMFQLQGAPQDQPAYSLALFSVATLVIGLAVLRWRVAWGKLAWPVGSLVGLSNLLQLEAMLKALAVLPAIIVFPVSSALTVAINALLAMGFWKERLEARARLGVALAILAAIFLNLQH